MQSSKKPSTRSGTANSKAPNPTIAESAAATHYEDQSDFEMDYEDQYGPRETERKRPAVSSPAGKKPEKKKNSKKKGQSDPAPAKKPRDVSKITRAVEDILNTLEGLSNAEKQTAIRMVGGAMRFSIIPIASSMGLVTVGSTEAKAAKKERPKGKASKSKISKKPAQVVAAETARASRIADLKAAKADFTTDVVRAECRQLNQVVKDARKAFTASQDPK